MIDWYSLVFSAFWISGLAILLAAFSHHYWLAPQEGHNLRQQLEQPAFLQHFWISFSFISIGLAGTSHRKWETIVWIIFLMISAVNAIKMIRMSKQ
jgi:hypothetical protein